MVETVIVVHGTFSKDSTWWRRGGSFCIELNRRLESLNSEARAWSHLETDDVEFQWSGANSEQERRLAANKLAAYIRKLNQREDVSAIHYVAHSHGGNVLRMALQNAPWEKNASVIFLGTPFYEYSNSRISKRSFLRSSLRVFSRVLFFISLMLISVVISFFIFESLFPSIVFLMSILGFLLLLLGHVGSIEMEGRSILESLLKSFVGEHPALGASGSLYSGDGWCFLYRSDEAFHLLRIALAIREGKMDPLAGMGSVKFESYWLRKYGINTKDIIKYFPKFYRDSYLSKEKETKKRNFFSGELFFFKEIILDDLNFFSELGDRSLVKYLIFFFSPVFLVCFLLGWVSRLLAWPVYLIFAIIFILLDYLVLAPAVCFFGVLNRIISRIGVRALASRAFGDDTYLSSIKDVADLPNLSFVRRVVIPEEVEKQHLDCVAEYASSSVSKLYEEILIDGVDAEGIYQDLPSQLEKVFSEPYFIHCVYYHDAWIVDSMSKIISSTENDLLSDRLHYGDQLTVEYVDGKSETIEVDHRFFDKL